MCNFLVLFMGCGVQCVNMLSDTDAFCKAIALSVCLRKEKENLLLGQKMV